MQPFETLSGPAAPLLKANIDTDVIIRIERLTGPDRDHLGRFALEALRMRPDGSEDPDFVLNQPAFRKAPVLIAGQNFGCGSSREGAVVALLDRGIRCVVAPSFGDIFYGNCFQNGLLPVRLPEADVEALAQEATAPGAVVAIDLASQNIVTPLGRTLAFDMDPHRRDALLRGLDDVGQTLLLQEEVVAWQAADRQRRPWVWNVSGSTGVPVDPPDAPADTRTGPTANDGDTAAVVAERVERFVRDVIAPYEKDPRRDEHGAPTYGLVEELRGLARDAGLLTPHIAADGSHFAQRGTARILRATGLSPLGPVALNTAAPDEGNMFLLSKVGSDKVKERYLRPLIEGTARSAFFMTEPADENGAGSDPSMMRTRCWRDGDDWVIDGRKAFITGALGATFGIIMAKSEDGACMFLVDLPAEGLSIESVPNTLDTSLPGGHAVVRIDNLRVCPGQMLGTSGEGFAYAQVRLAPARLSHCMRWLGACQRVHEIATDYANRRLAFGKLLIDHEGVGFMLAENLIDLKQAELMVDWCADVLDSGVAGTMESSMAKVAVSEGLMRVADRSVQVMGGRGLTSDTIVEQVFREVRAFRIYDGPTEVHKWSIAKRVKRQWRTENT